MHYFFKDIPIDLELNYIRDTNLTQDYNMLVFANESAIILG